LTIASSIFLTKHVQKVSVMARAFTYFRCLVVVIMSMAKQATSAEQIASQI